MLHLEQRCDLVRRRDLVRQGAGVAHFRHTPSRERGQAGGDPVDFLLRQLARGLADIAPQGLSRVFYSDSGSTAVEVALKMALGFWHNSGRPRTKIIALEHAYHGDTIGTMAAGARGVFNAAYAPLLFDVVRLPFPTGRGCASPVLTA